jgi:hypothetical protein
VEPKKNADVISYVRSPIRSSLFFAIIILSIFILVRAKDMAPFVQIPFDLKSGYLVFSVPVEPSGSLSLLFDTGCQTTTISKDVLEHIGEQSITLLLGTRKLKIDNFHIRPSTGLSNTISHKIDGVIGNDILHRFTVKIDFNNRILALFDSEAIVAFAGGDDIGIGVNALVSSVPLTITFPGGKQVEGEFMIDTGAPINAVINSPAAEKYGLQTVLGRSKKREFLTKADVQTAAHALAESVRIGKFECANVEIYISTSKKGLFAGTKYAGIVGNKFLQNFNVIFDYKRKRLHIERY